MTNSAGTFILFNMVLPRYFKRFIKANRCHRKPWWIDRRFRWVSMQAWPCFGVKKWLGSNYRMGSQKFYWSAHPHQLQIIQSSKYFWWRRTPNWKAKGFVVSSQLNARSRNVFQRLANRCWSWIFSPRRNYRQARKSQKGMAYVDESLIYPLFLIIQ